ncbi:response regulator [Yoonia sp. R2331]|uniref:response regulator n=1 Tax=Yoonia sp. R2331 TaxID=3237238 RepID=UPI0034E3C28E
MTIATAQDDLSATVAAHLPYLRRYARALTGSQDSGDAFALATLQDILSDPGALTGDGPVKVALFAVMHRIWTGRPPVDADDAATRIEAAAQAHLAKLTPATREALLLQTLEGFSDDEVGQIIGTTAAKAARLIGIAHAEMAQSVVGDILIIEDEAVIAMDLETIVSEVGHTVTGVARTHAAALELARTARPGLILADIQLADKSSGIDAVNDLLGLFGDVPVIFITAFPERLLTGAKPEPAFLITKPYAEDQVRSAVAQAMFFASTETLQA